jgi:hypothetical protein
MILWYAAGSVCAVWAVFQSAGLDFRSIAIGALLPLIDVVVGHQALAHTLLAPTLTMVLVMLTTVGRGKRLIRRRAIGIPIGWYFGIGLSGSFTDQHVFWWPAFGRSFGETSIWPPLGWAIALELIGVAAAAWVWVRFELADPRRRAEFVRSGRLVAA